MVHCLSKVKLPVDSDTGFPTVSNSCQARALMVPGWFRDVLTNLLSSEGDSWGLLSDLLNVRIRITYIYEQLFKLMTFESAVVLLQENFSTSVNPRCSLMTN